MPASNLTPAQRQAQRRKQEQQRQRREAAAAAKPGQKGQRTNNRGSGFRNSTSTTTTNRKPSPSGGESWRGKVGNVPSATLRKQQNDAITNHPANKPKPQAKASPQPAPSRPASTSSPAPVSPRVSSSTPPAGTVPSAPSKPSTASSGGSYGPDGKGLYNAHKKDNPLMKRTFGYQTGDHGSKEPRGTGPVADAKTYLSTKEKDDKLGRTSGQGPVASSAEYGNALQKSQAESKARAEKLKIQRDELNKKRKDSTSWGGA